MFSLPVHCLVDAHLINSLRKTIGHGNGEPLPTFSGFDPVTVLKFVFLVLDGIQQTKDITASQLVEIAQPREILGLMDSYNGHGTANSFIFSPDIS